MLALALQLLLPGSLQHLPVDPLIEKGRTPYAALHKRFTRATALSIRDLNREYPGRCYFFDSPTRPVASLLVAGAIDKKSLGPAFDSDDYRRVTPLIDTDAKPSAFDRLTPEIRAKAQEVVERDGIHNAYPVANRGSLLIEGFRTVTYQKRTYELRRTDRYFVLRLKCNEDTYCLNYRDGGPTNRVLNNSGETNAVCYYWGE